MPPQRSVVNELTHYVSSELNDKSLPRRLLAYSDIDVDVLNSDTDELCNLFEKDERAGFTIPRMEIIQLQEAAKSLVAEMIQQENIAFFLALDQAANTYKDRTMRDAFQRGLAAHRTMATPSVFLSNPHVFEYYARLFDCSLPRFIYDVPICMTKLLPRRTGFIVTTASELGHFNIEDLTCQESVSVNSIGYSISLTRRIKGIVYPNVTKILWETES